MRHTVSVRLERELAAWLDATARSRGMSQSDVIRSRLEESRCASDTRAFMTLAGSVDGSAGLSARKGFSRK
jgi:Arc/MetJ-type ribon-helix-helix transcriptional regulator